MARAITKVYTTTRIIPKGKELKSTCHAVEFHLEFDDGTTLTFPAVWSLKDLRKNARNTSRLITSLFENVINLFNDECQGLFDDIRMEQQNG